MEGGRGVVTGPCSGLAFGGVGIEGEERAPSSPLCGCLGRHLRRPGGVSAGCVLGCLSGSEGTVSTYSWDASMRDWLLLKKQFMGLMAPRS